MPEEEFKRFKIKKESPTNVWWRDSLFFFFDISGYVVGPLIIAYILGKFIDKKLESEPWGITIALITAFMISITMIVYKTIKHMSELEQLEKDKAVKESKHNS